MSSIAFGVVVPAAGSSIDERLDRLVAALGKRIGTTLEWHDADSYEELAEDVRSGRFDVAWLPPIVFLHLADAVTPLGSIVRGSTASYESALVVRSDAKMRTIDGLRGMRAGWVDRWSSSGYVLPRVNLSLLGVDPRSLFATEAFYGSHRAAIRALLDGACDVAGTYAHANADGDVTAGPWSEIGAEVKVLATFGAIPPDVIAARSSVPEPMVKAVQAAFTDVSKTESRLLYEVFNGTDFSEGLADGYPSLEKALQMAASRGIFGDRPF